MRAPRHLPAFLVLLVAWICVNGDLSWANVAAGSLVAAGLVTLVAVKPNGWHHRFDPLALAGFIGFVLWNLVVSSVQVVRTVLWPTAARVRSGIVEVHLQDTSPLVTMMVANAISLTPGTITLTAENRPAVLTVHVLGLADVDEFRASVVDLHRRATASFTPIEEVAP